MEKNFKIWIVTDGTDTLVQSRELAHHLTSAKQAIQINYDLEIFGENANWLHQPNNYINPSTTAALEAILDNNKNIIFPEYVIAVGFKSADMLLKIKQQSGEKTKIISILDPLKDYQKFDYIILPSYEPYKINGNIIWTTGLINFVNAEFLSLALNEYKTFEKYKYLREANLNPPFLTVTLGGKHTGGNISVEDAKILAAKINKIVTKNGGTALITSSSRTEIATTECLKEKLKVPYFLYDYKKREHENPYGVFLSLADEIITTGDSVRMMSEACSAAKRVRIYRPIECGFQYQPLINQFINGGYAIEFNEKTNPANNTPHPPSPTLNEAKRVAELIKL